MITLKTLPEATAQEVFEQVAKHLIKQNDKSIDYGLCRYKKVRLTCAAGCLIGDNEYNEERMERNSWITLVKEKLVPKNHSDLICDLQKVHDNKDVDKWKEELTKVAIAHNLDYSFLNN